MSAAVLSPFTSPLHQDPRLADPSPDLLARLETCNIMLRKMEARTALLAWASSVVGLPISHISQVQNGAVLCYIVAVLCEEPRIDLSQVRFLAVDEFEYVMNFKILQKVASDGYIDGLNRDAKLRDWIRLARSRSDAWLFLDLLRKTFKEVGLGDYEVNIECDATPPPPPLTTKRGSSGSKDEMSAKDIVLRGGHWRHGRRSKDTPLLLNPRPSDATLEVGQRVIDLADAWTRQDQWNDELETIGYSDYPVTSGPATPSTRRAHAILRSFLQDDSSSSSSCSRTTSIEFSLTPQNSYTLSSRTSSGDSSAVF